MPVGGMEVVLIVLAIFLLFGASRLPKLAKSLGESRKAFKEGMDQAESEHKLEESDESKKLDASPNISSISDEEFAAELKKRSAAS